MGIAMSEWFSRGEGAKEPLASNIHLVIPEIKCNNNLRKNDRKILLPERRGFSQQRSYISVN